MSKTERYRALEIQKSGGWGVREGFESDWASIRVGKMQDLDMWRLGEKGSQSLHERKDQIQGHNKYIHSSIQQMCVEPLLCAQRGYKPWDCSGKQNQVPSLMELMF